MISARTAAGAFGLLLCSAAIFYFGYIWWGLSWLGNIAATVIVASVTTAVIDRVIVRYRRVRLTTTLKSGRRRVESSCNRLIERVNDIREQVDRAQPKPPYWIAGGGYTSAGVEDSWRLELEELNDAVNAWTVLTGYGVRSLQTNAINEGLANLRDAHSEALDAYERLATHMDSRKTLFSGLFGEPPPQPDEGLLKAAEIAASRATNTAHKAVATIEALKTGLAHDDVPARVARRHPFRIPRWLQAVTVLSAVAWAAVLAYAQLTPAKFPGNFVEDNLLNIVANIAIALFAGALTIALAQGRRVVIAKNALPYYPILVNLCLDISIKATPPGHPDLRLTLAKTADYIADLTSAIQNESPSAELAFWTLIGLYAMKRGERPRSLASVSLPPDRAVREPHRR